MMKKAISVILVITMLLSFSISAYAIGSVVPFFEDKEAEKENGVGRLSDEEVVEAATRWLSENAPECIPEIYVEEVFVDAPLSNIAEITFGRKINGIPFEYYHCIDMEVNRVTGKVCCATSFWHELKSAADPKKMLREEKLQDILFEKSNFKLVYDRVRDTDYMIPVYIPEFSYVEIDAVTGEEFKRYYGFGSTGGSSGGSGGQESKGVVIRTSEVEDTTGLISKEKIEEILKGLTDTVLPESRIEKISYSEPLPGEYTAYVHLYYGDLRISVQLDGKTGEDIYINGTRPPSTGGKRKTQEEMKKVCDRFLKSQMGDSFEELSFISGNDDGEFVYGLFKNGIEVWGRKAYIEVDPVSGKIYDYSNSADVDFEYAPADSLISIEEAWKLTLENCGIEIIYNIARTEEPAEAQLIYRFDWYNSDFIAVDARSGKLLDGWLEEVEEEEQKPEKELVLPTDIKGHWAEEAITACIENGILDDTEKFNSEENLTLGEVSGIISEAFGRSVHKDSTFFYATRESTVVCLMKMLGFTGEEEECKSFAKGFSDKNEVFPEHIGYVAAASNLGIISGYGDGTFRPGRLITRAEFATMLYNVLVK